MRTVGVVTVGRSDYGLMQPVMRAITRHPALKLSLYVGGQHLTTEFGHSVKLVEADGYDIAARVESLLPDDSPEGIAASIGLGVAGFGRAYAERKPDILVVIGDRFEMYAAALASLPFKIPLAHIHGGERTEGAIDDVLRHSMTKMSHLHFPSTATYARRIAQLGEEPWRITISGAPGLDNLHECKLLTRNEIETRFGVKLEKPPLVVTFHPVTLEFEQAAAQIDELLAAIDESGEPVIFTQPNADTGGRLIQRRIEAYVSTRTNAWLTESLGTAGYFGLMTLAKAMVGNSSSGLLEAPSFGLPVVNIGSRQGGRVRGINVIDVGYARAEILAGIRRACDPAFRASLAARLNPYGDGHAAPRIVNRLAEETLDTRLLVKGFCDLPVTTFPVEEPWKTSV